MTAILCVDDDVDFAVLVRYALECAGYEVRLATHGRDALHAMRTEHIDLVLLDLTLPDVDGLHVLKALRAVSSVPVILLTARVEDDQIRLGLAHEAVAYVAKPFAFPLLLQHITHVLHSPAHALAHRRPHSAGGAPPRPCA